MKKKFYFFGFIAILVVSLYFIDRGLWMKKRVLRHRFWEIEDKYRSERGNYISAEDIIFKNDTMFINYNNTNHDTLIFKWQYFDRMKVLNLRTGKTAIYSMKGANWTNYLFD